MPCFDGTGPAGMGPRTGGCFGYCPPGAGTAQGWYPPEPWYPPQTAGYGYPVIYGIGRGGVPRGCGRGRGYGGGRGRGSGNYGFGGGGRGRW